MPPTIKSVVISFAVLIAVLSAMQWLRPREKRLAVLRRGFWTDLAYWAFTPLVTRAITRVSVVMAVVPIVLLIYGRVDKELLLNGFGPASRLPLWLQAVLILMLGDFVGYWMHRIFHRPRLWRFHAVHHSSVELDWLSAVRLHPVNDALMRVAATLPILLLGFAPIAVAGIAPVLTAMAILVHANLDWDWGPLRVIIVSPRFHRWHHTDEASARDKNFAGLLPLWDVLFGTYYMPRDRLPENFGTNTPVPAGLVGQMLFPFKHKSRPEAPALQGSAL